MDSVLRVTYHIPTHDMRTYLVELWTAARRFIHRQARGQRSVERLASTLLRFLLWALLPEETC